MAHVMVLLIAVAVAFPAGWLVCRAWLIAKGHATDDAVSQEQHEAMLQAQRSRYRGQVQRVVEVVRRHETARDQIKAKLTEVSGRLDSSEEQNRKLRLQLSAAQQEIATQRSTQTASDEHIESRQSALSLLQIERDELRAQVRRLETETKTAATHAGNNPVAADERAERGELREKLAAAEHRRHELETRLADREARIEELARTVDSWKHRVVPLTHQVHTYREALRKAKQDKPAQAPNDSSPADPLQKIKGIGPALERRLKAQGIQRFAQIAALEPTELADLADKLAISPTLPARDQWIEQACDLAESSGAQTVTT